MEISVELCEDIFDVIIWIRLKVLRECTEESDTYI